MYFQPENILIDIEGHIKLTDFGLCKRGMKSSELTNSFCGSPEYMVNNYIFILNIQAPEIVTRVGHSYGADFYALGALLHELVCGLPPFYSQNPEEMMNNIITK